MGTYIFLEVERDILLSKGNWVEVSEWPLGLGFLVKEFWLCMEIGTKKAVSLFKVYNVRKCSVHARSQTPIHLQLHTQKPHQIENA